MTSPATSPKFPLPGHTKPLTFRFIQTRSLRIRNSGSCARRGSYLGMSIPRGLQRRGIASTHATSITLCPITRCLDTLNAYAMLFFLIRGAQKSVISLLRVSLTFPRIVMFLYHHSIYVFVISNTCTTFTTHSDPSVSNLYLGHYKLSGEDITDQEEHCVPVHHF